MHSNLLECNNGDLSVSELGLLEMCVNNTWTRICAEFLGEREAAVVCQQLGFSVGEGEPCHISLK